MALSESVQSSLKEAEASLRNALAFAARGEHGDMDVDPANTLVGAELVGDDYLVEVEVEAFVPELASAAL